MLEAAWFFESVSWLKSRETAIVIREPEGPSPSQRLQGLTLNDGWRVVAPVSRRPYSTGGCFSHGYLVEREGQEGYLKALDFSAALQAKDPAQVLQAMTAAFNFERSVCDTCTVRRLDHVVRAIASGTVLVDPTRSDGIVQYLIFEKAGGDVRGHFTSADRFDFAWALRALHNVAVGLSQLHKNGIAHQDLKPSNVLVFPSNLSKVGDLGRSASRSVPAPHDEATPAGDRGYAPPELLYQEIDPDWSRRRFGCDAYLLGSLLFFFFTGASTTALMLDAIPPNLHWTSCAEPFRDLLPQLRAAFDEAMKTFAQSVPKELHDDLLPAARQLCDPDPKLRGHPELRGRPGNQYALDRYISLFDLLATKARHGLLGSR